MKSTAPSGDYKHRKLLASNLQGNVRDAQAFNSAATPTAAAFFTARPSHTSTQLNNKEFRLNARVLLGLPPTDDALTAPGIPPRCITGKCGKEFTMHLDHAFTCCSSNGAIARRSNAVRDAITKECRNAGLHAKIEPYYDSSLPRVPGLPNDAPGAQSRADISIDINLRHLLVDVVITHATGQSRIGAAPKETGAVANEAATNKLRALAKHHVANAGTMLPFSMETTGYYTPQAGKLLEEIAIAQVARRVHAVSNLVGDAAASARVDRRLLIVTHVQRRIQERIAVAVARGNSFILSQWINRQNKTVPATQLVNQVQLVQPPPAPIWPAQIAPVSSLAVV